MEEGGDCRVPERVLGTLLVFLGLYADNCASQLLYKFYRDNLWEKELKMQKEHIRNCNPAPSQTG